MSELREKFVALWGEDQARILEECCDMHVGQRAGDPIVIMVSMMLGDMPGDHVNDNRGSDPFRYVILAVLGYECVTKPEYAAHHGITVDAWDFVNWVLTEADLDSFDGDHPDHLTMTVEILTRFMQDNGDIPR